MGRKGRQKGTRTGRIQKGLFYSRPHIYTQGKSHGRKIYCTFVDFWKAFDRVPRAQLILRLEEMGVPMELVWGILALYGAVKGPIRTPEGVSELIHSTIGVKQGCPLSPTLFGLYIDEILAYIEKGDERGAKKRARGFHYYYT